MIFDYNVIWDSMPLYLNGLLETLKLLGISLFAAMFVFAGNTLADMLARWVDPRLDRLEMHHHGH